MTHALQSESGEPDGWPGVFQHLLHYVPGGSPRLLLDSGSLVVVAACGSSCVPPTNSTADWPWCPDCQRILDTA